MKLHAKIWKLRKCAIKRWKSTIKVDQTEGKLGGSHWWWRIKQEQGFKADRHQHSSDQEGCWKLRNY